MSHTEWRENVLGDVLFEELAADALDDVAAEPNAEVGIARNDTRREETARLIMNEEVAQRGLLLGFDENDVANSFFETAGMGHQVAQSDGAAEGGSNLKVEILVDVGVEIELALLLQLHDCDPSEKLGDGCEAKDGGRGFDGLFVFEVGIAVALLQEEFAVPHDQDGGTGHVGTFELQRDDAIEASRSAGVSWWAVEGIAGGVFSPPGPGWASGFFVGAGLGSCDFALGAPSASVKVRATTSIRTKLVEIQPE